MSTDPNTKTTNTDTTATTESMAKLNSTTQLVPGGKAHDNPFWKTKPALRIVRFMGSHLEDAKYIAEIFALIIAGAWGLMLYRERDVPANQARALVTSTLRWTNKTASGCAAEYTVTFKNIGRTTIDLDRPRITFGLVRRPDVSADVKYINPKELLDGISEKRRLSDNEFATSYPPDTSDTVTSLFTLTKDLTRLFVVKIDFPPKSGSQRKSGSAGGWLDYQWARVCEEGDLVNAPQQPPQSRVR